ncbi:hypothetical protein DCAR_0727136 [Daucus carota subsp. sativus]|uniref:Uncharacterized protein n=1 Tax=Daucus carota subsp. sativus TaxID=79200 RepID=A0A164SRD8_DAUCS|nr:hypothetical protein DCAR_0727136 [Daucus carota subsp. sativus]
MSFSGRKRSCSATYTSSLILLLTISCLYTWASTSCKAEAYRILREQKQAPQDQQQMRNITAEADRFREFFSSKVSQDSDLSNNNNNSTDTNKGFQEEKRRVPSCPDPLHN